MGEDAKDRGEGPPTASGGSGSGGEGGGSGGDKEVRCLFDALPRSFSAAARRPGSPPRRRRARASNDPTTRETDPNVSSLPAQASGGSGSDGNQSQERDNSAVRFSGSQRNDHDYAMRARAMLPPPSAHAARPAETRAIVREKHRKPPSVPLRARRRERRSRGAPSIPRVLPRPRAPRDSLVSHPSLSSLNALQIPRLSESPRARREASPEEVEGGGSVGARSDKPDSNGMGEAGDGGSGNGSGEDDDSKPKNQPPVSPAPRFDSRLPAQDRPG